MNIGLGKIRESPFVGVFAIATEKHCFVPYCTAKKEEKQLLDLFDVEIIRTAIADTSLIGVLAAANSRGMVVGDITSEKEVLRLQQAGLRIKTISNITAIGNLLRANDTKGACSALLNTAQRKEIEKALGVEIITAKIAGSDLVGAGMVATNKGMVVNKMASREEIQALRKHFGFGGALATANSGDLFIGNSLIANSSAALAGANTTGFETARLDEGLGGE
ncbi:MAG: translation initiation factor IF-6 [Candidatus Diapherotrites archaeon]|nr:translation initiation factor IF-6 [Candidatus Diapherotrites archaeon]